MNLSRYSIHAVPAAMCLIALAHLPYGFFQILRIIVTFCAAVIAYRAFSACYLVTAWLLAMVAVLYNPVVKIHMSRDVHMVGNVLTAALFIWTWWCDRDLRSSGPEA